jgi:hypothetical protein
MKRDELAIWLCGCFHKAKPENLDAVWRCQDQITKDRWNSVAGYVSAAQSAILNEIESPLKEYFSKYYVSPESPLRGILATIERNRKE